MEFFELISDAIDQPIRGIHVEGIANPVDAVFQVAEVATHEITKGRSDIQIELLNFGSSRHCGVVDHVYTIHDIGARAKTLCQYFDWHKAIL